MAVVDITEVADLGITPAVLASVEDLATAVEEFESSTKGGLTWQNMVGIGVDPLGGYHIVAAHEVPKALDLFEVLNNSGWTGAKILPTNVKRIAPVRLSRGTASRPARGQNGRPWPVAEALLNPTTFSAEFADKEVDSIPVALRQSDGLSFPIVAVPKSIGRSLSADYTVNGGNNVSRKHAMLQVRSGHPLISDNESANGTRVNGIRISTPTRLAVGDVVMLGDLRLNVVAS